MFQYRTKPVVIEAFQYVDLSDDKTTAYPSWFLRAMASGDIYETNGGKTYVKTLEGDMSFNDGDWIVRGVKGELYPVKADIFAETYEPV